MAKFARRLLGVYTATGPLRSMGPTFVLPGAIAINSIGQAEMQRKISRGSPTAHQATVCSTACSFPFLCLCPYSSTANSRLLRPLGPASGACLFLPAARRSAHALVQATYRRNGSCRDLFCPWFCFGSQSSPSWLDYSWILRKANPSHGCCCLAKGHLP